MIYRLSTLALWASLTLVLSCACDAPKDHQGTAPRGTGQTSNTSELPVGMQRATFAGGCFWCMEKPFDAVSGVTETVVGYTGGTDEDPTYGEVSAGQTDHVEAIEVTFDPKVVNYDALLTTFWHNIDPTQTDGQFADRGDQYKTAIFYHSPEQQRAAETSKRALDQSGKFNRPIYPKVLPATPFWRAEEYHQAYYQKNPEHYTGYHRGSGRAGFIERVWKD